MKILFCRNTHDEQGNYRGDSYFGAVDQGKELYFGVHGLSKDGLTLEEVYLETQKMLIGGALCGKYDPKDPRLTIEGHLKALAYMAECRLCKIKILVG